MTSYFDIVICIEPDRILETWPPIYRGAGEAGQGQIEIEPIEYHAYSQHTSNLALFVLSLASISSDALFPRS
jgi:hypothetical protein